MNSSLDLDDTMPIGKYKSAKLADLIKEDPGYLLWLRNARKDADAKFFSPMFSALLDNEIAKSKYLQSKFKPWGVDVAAATVTSMAAVPEPKRAEAYLEWGGF